MWRPLFSRADGSAPKNYASVVDDVLPKCCSVCLFLCLATYVGVVFKTLEKAF